MDIKSLENMSGQEIKEMIDDKIISIEELDCSALEKVLNYEIDMLCLGTGDMMTIRYCSALLNERSGSDNMSKERIISIIDKTKSEHITIVDENNTKKSKEKIVKKQNIILRRIGLVAAIIALMIATTTIVCAAFGINLFEYICETARDSQGTENIVDNFTFYNNGEAKKYSSIEEMIAQENLDIMYPTKWPEGVNIETIQIIQLSNGNSAIQVFTNDMRVNINIELSCEPLNSAGKESYEYNGVLFYLDSARAFSASCFYNDNKYYISATTKEDLILIIENLKEK